MLVNREWNDHPELFGAVVDALEEVRLDVRGSTEESSYRDQGSIRVLFEGRCFYLELREEL